MKEVKIRSLCLGSGRPKICVPIVGKTKEDIRKQAQSILEDGNAQLVEWRADWFEAVFDKDALADILQELRVLLGDMPLLYTFRTQAEGGEQAITDVDYQTLGIQAIQSGFIDLIDVEFMKSPQACERLLQEAHTYGVKVIASNHDFHKTPPKEEIVSRLKAMEAAGMDVAKLAVMPNSQADVKTLLDATYEAHQAMGIPVITMSMGSLGAISRVAGQLYGSAVTFGTVGCASAPGQLAVGDLQYILKLLEPQK
jgi:3-dehydroquinate dehydratase-1